MWNICTKYNSCEVISCEVALLQDKIRPDPASPEELEDLKMK